MLRAEKTRSATVIVAEFSAGNVAVAV